jgi:chitinase
MTDVSAFASVLDYVTIMNYDVFGPWSSTVGPNTPINDSCAPSVSDQQGSAVTALAAWTEAKFPASQILLGLATYAHSYSVAPSDAFTASGALALYPPFNKSNQPLGNTDLPPGSPPSYDQCGNLVGPSGTFDFRSLINDGYLTTDGTNATGIDYIFDSCSETPYIYNASSQVMISYDDAKSFAVKGNFIMANGLKGYNAWFIQGDYDDILVDSINSAIGFEPNC